MGLGAVVLLGGLYAAYRIWYTPLEASPRQTGEPAPAFSLTDQTGQTVTLAGLLESGPAVVIFYRGHW